jgi:hypothetical protein
MGVFLQETKLLLIISTNGTLAYKLYLLNFEGLFCNVSDKFSKAFPTIFPLQRRSGNHKEPLQCYITQIGRHFLFLNCKEQLTNIL